MSWSDASRILAVRLDAMGDVVMTLPALCALKHAVPGRHVTLLTSRRGAPVAPLCPDIDNVVVYDAPWVQGGGEEGPGADLEMVARLRAGSFDGAVLFTAYRQSPLPAALLCRLAGIPLRLAHCRENPFRLLTHPVPETEPHQQVRHEVQRQLDLVGVVGAPPRRQPLRLAVPDAVRRRARERLRAAGVDLERRYLVVHPGASASARRYPAAGFAQAAAVLARTDREQVVVTGSLEEAPLVQEVRDAVDARCHALAGALELAELAAVVQDAALLVANHSGPAHLAAAVGTPVVSLYALTSPQHTPWGVPSRVLFHDVPCRYCEESVCPQPQHPCLQRVDPQDVVRAARELLAAGKHAPVCEHAMPPAVTVFGGVPAGAGNPRRAP